jgi:hypothetical protein
MAERLSAAATGGDIEQSIASLWQSLDDNPAFARIVTWAILDGQNVSSIMTKHPVARDVTIVAAQGGAANPPIVGAMTVLVGIAGAVFGPTINRALQRDANDREIYDTATTMLANWITTEQS